MEEMQLYVGRPENTEGRLPREIHTYDYTVSSNDTLWNISKDVCNKSNENLDIQNVVHDIKYRNKLSNSDIYVGQVLEIPIY